MLNAVGREIPEEILERTGKEVFQGNNYKDGKAFQKASPKVTPVMRNDHDKMVKDIHEALVKCNAHDGMTVSFHHHFREGDLVVCMVMEEIHKMGFKNITLSASSLGKAHDALVPMIEDGTIVNIESSGVRGKIGDAISHGKLKGLATMRSHGGRVRAIETGETHVDIAFIGAPSCDEYGNCTVHREIGPLDVTAMAQACKNSGGKVIVQVEKIVQGGSLDPKLVAIPGIYVDSVVVGTDEENMQCLGMPYDGALTGEFRIPVDAIPPIPMDAKKIIARRAAMELPQDAIVNLGTGAPEKIANVAAEEGISDKMTLTVEAGSIAGVPYGGTQFGAAANAQCIIPHNVQFDFYQGGGLDVAFLGLAETAPNGDLNVSKFGTRLAGAGGFIDITQNAKKVVYCGTFTAKGLKTECKDGKLVITQEGAKKKFVKQVEHITFSGDYANEVHQPVLYITERCVFELRPEGVTLTEIAPGIDLQTQILDQMEFVPKMADEIKTMDARIFRDELMGLAND